VIKRALIALQFLTIIPLKIRGTVQTEDLAGSMTWYPLVGACLGAMSAFIFWIVLQFFSFPVAIVTSVISLIILSGALHLDGLADMCDGFYGGRDRDRVLAIMKDSHSGAMAVVGIFCLLSLKIAFLSEMDPKWLLRTLIVVPAIGRWSMVWLCAKSRYARNEGGTASGYVGHVKSSGLAMATATGAVLAAVFLGWRGLAALAIAAMATEIFRRYVEHRIGGMTGDTLGACSELVEVLVLIVLSLHWAPAIASVAGVTP
jgi:adenosylcobinamide-GDP ribazoletransferase